MNVASSSDDPQPSLWRLGMVVGLQTVNAYEEALEPFCDSISWIVNEAEDRWEIEGFSQIDPDAARVAEAMAIVAQAFGEAAPTVEIGPHESRDWLADNLRQFPPINAGRYFIYGTHFEGTPPVGRTGICLNPGRAFGSGDHATTQGCLLALDDLARSRNFQSVLDMGCGSGILAIAMAKTWARTLIRPALASDIDPQAALVSIENSQYNGVSSVVHAVTGNGYTSRNIIVGGPYDLIVSNILANPLCRMANDLGRHLRRSEQGGGIAVLSGFLIRDARRVLSAHQQQGLRLLRWYDIKGWRTLVLQRPDNKKL